MSFCTAINCMDGRVQVPVIEYLTKRYGVYFVDMVTEAGPNRILAEGTNKEALASIEQRVRISLEEHQSNAIAVIGHDDCAGNPTTKKEQVRHSRAAVQALRQMFADVPVIALWVDSNWQISEIGD